MMIISRGIQAARAGLCGVSCNSRSVFASSSPYCTVFGRTILRDYIFIAFYLRRCEPCFRPVGKCHLKTAQHRIKLAKSDRNLDDDAKLATRTPPRAVPSTKRPREARAPSSPPGDKPCRCGIEAPPLFFRRSSREASCLSTEGKRGRPQPLQVYPSTCRHPGRQLRQPRRWPPRWWCPWARR